MGTAAGSRPKRIKGPPPYRKQFDTHSRIRLVGVWTRIESMRAYIDSATYNGEYHVTSKSQRGCGK